MNPLSSLQLTFTPLEEHHLNEIMAIEIEAYPESWSLGMFRDEIANRNSHFYVALLGDELVGYCGFWLIAKEIHITSLTVRDRHRGNRFGRRQLDFLLDAARKLGASTATLEVRESNRWAYDLYCAAGFRAVGRRRGYYTKTGEDAILMDLDLRDSARVVGGNGSIGRP